MDATKPLVHSDPAIMGGVPVFVGSRLPVQTVMDCIAAGDSWERLQESWPWLTKEHLAAASAWQCERAAADSLDVAGLIATMTDDEVRQLVHDSRGTIPDMPANRKPE
jgi:uncharacterized protein (DUF433 family)